MRYDAEHKQRTRSRVLKEAAAAIRAEGPDRIGVAAIMGRAGLTHGGFYAHFTSKDELLVAAIGEMFDTACAYFEELSAGKPAGEGLAAYVAFYLSRYHRDHREEGCPIATMAADLPRLAPEARVAFEQGAARLTTLIAGQLEALGRPDPGIAAVSLLSEMVGAVVLARSIADPAHSTAILRASRQAIRERLGLPLPPAPAERDN
ncbi:MAG: TetR/AcrR family transcriptional regulator [Rhizobacter sp.]|nr:TetR/AcrR family transcriptional regulator [Rhizobacter sp.]